MVCSGLFADCSICFTSSEILAVHEEHRLVMNCKLPKVIESLTLCSITINHRTIDAKVRSRILLFEVMFTLEIKLPIEIFAWYLFWELCLILFSCLGFVLKLSKIILMIRKCNKMTSVAPSKRAAARIGNKGCL